MWLLRTEVPSPLPPVRIAFPLVSFGIIIECVTCFVRDGASNSQQEMDVQLLFQQQEKIQLNFPGAPFIGGIGRNRGQGPSGLSMGDWALELIIQWAESSWAVLQPFEGETQKPKVWGEVDQKPKSPAMSQKTERKPGW